MMAHHCCIIVLTVIVRAVTSEPSLCDHSSFCDDKTSRLTTTHDNNVFSLCHTHHHIYSALYAHPYTTICSTVRTNVHGEFNEYYMNEHTAYTNASSLLVLAGFAPLILVISCICLCLCFNTIGDQCCTTSPDPAPVDDPTPVFSVTGRARFYLRVNNTSRGGHSVTGGTRFYLRGNNTRRGGLPVFSVAACDAPTPGPLILPPSYAEASMVAACGVPAPDPLTMPPQREEEIIVAACDVPTPDPLILPPSYEEAIMMDY